MVLPSNTLNAARRKSLSSVLNFKRLSRLLTLNHFEQLREVSSAGLIEISLGTLDRSMRSDSFLVRSLDNYDVIKLCAPFD